MIRSSPNDSHSSVTDLDRMQLCVTSSSDRCCPPSCDTICWSHRTWHSMTHRYLTQKGTSFVFIKQSGEDMTIKPSNMSPNRPRTETTHWGFGNMIIIRPAVFYAVRHQQWAVVYRGASYLNFSFLCILRLKWLGNSSQSTWSSCVSSRPALMVLDVFCYPESDEKLTQFISACPQCVYLQQGWKQGKLITRNPELSDLGPTQQE